MKEILKLVCHTLFTVAVETGLINASEGPVLDMPRHIFSVNVFQNLCKTKKMKVTILEII